MSRAARLALPVVALRALGAAAGDSNDITLFCRYACAGGTYNDVCNAVACGTPATGCSLYAWQPFHDDDVCEGYLKTKPSCVGPPLSQCTEAATFQLVYDRFDDMARTYSVEDFPGVGRTWRNITGALFVPGGTSFVVGRDAVANFVQDFHATDVAKAQATVNFVHSIGGNATNPEYLHSVGTWQAWHYDSPPSTPSDWYAMWSVNEDQHWVMDVLVAAPPNFNYTAPLAESLSAAQDLPTYKEIAARQAQFNAAYNAGNFTALASEFFTEDAAIIPAVDRMPLTQKDAAAFFKGMPLTKQAKMESKIVTPSLDPSDFGCTAVTPSPCSVVHEIGFSDSTATGYYARWTRKSEIDPWQMKVLCLAVFPKAFLTQELVV